MVVALGDLLLRFLRESPVHPCSREGERINAFWSQRSLCDNSNGTPPTLFLSALKRELGAVIKCACEENRNKVQVEGHVLVLEAGHFFFLFRPGFF